MNRTIADMFGVMMMSFDGWLALWWVSIPLALFFLLTLGNLVYRRVPRGHASVVLCLLVPVCAIIFSAMAVLLAADHNSPSGVEDSVLPTRVLGALGIAAAIATGACILVAKRQRVVASSIALFGGWAVF